MRRWDFVAAFLQGELLDNEVLYCSMPSGYASNPSGADTVLRRIEKPIYGMAQGGGAAMTADHLPLPHSRGFRCHRVQPACSPGAKPPMQMPSGFSPHLGEVARASLARVTELCGAAF